MKLLVLDAVRLMLVVDPLHIEVVEGVLITGVGLTVTVIVYGEPAQFPVTDVGVIIYCTVPAVAVLGLVNV